MTKMTCMTFWCMIALTNKTVALSSIVRQCKWLYLPRKIVEIQNFWYHGNMTSHFSSPFSVIVTERIWMKHYCCPQKQTNQYHNSELNMTIFFSFPSSFILGKGEGKLFLSWHRDQPFLVSVNYDVLKNCSVNHDWSALRESWTVKILDRLHAHWRSSKENKSLIWPNNLN